MTPRLGHVPERDLGPYRFWRDRANAAADLAGAMARLDRVDLSLAMREAQAVLRAKAQSYRVVLDEQTEDPGRS